MRSQREQEVGARLATEYRRKLRNPKLIAELDRERRELRLADLISSIANTHPPLTAEARHRLAALLTKGGADGN